ncbi:MAG: FAD-dependent oxidoreductase [Treponema sp.]|nr:FAD-dependent oxidoreductase [Treponema sp.]
MKYVVIGASAAGLNGLKTLRSNDKNAEIVLIAPDNIIHSRCILHRFIDGERPEKKLNFTDDDLIEKSKVKWLKNKAAGVVLDNKLVLLDNGEKVNYDKLLIAAGSVTNMPPIKNLDKAKNVFGLHDFEDALAIKNNSVKAKHIGIIGSGLVGCDAISGVLGKGAKISCFEVASHMLPLNLDKYAAEKYQEAFAQKGLEQYYGVKVEEILLGSDNKICGLKLSDGRSFDCDMIIVTAGLKSNTEFLKNSGLKLDEKGLVYDKYGKTSNENVYAAGDISGKTAIWSAAVKEGIIAANNMSGTKNEMTDFFASKSTMNFAGIPTMSLGLAEKPDDSYTEVVFTDKKGNYKKIIHKNGEIKGAILQGDLSYAGILTQLIREKIDVSRVKKPLFSIDYSDFFGEFNF